MADSITARAEAPARTGTVDHIVAETRRAIVAGRMALGQRLVEADLTRDFGVSRASVREALQRLSAEGLVTIIPHRGALVRRLSRQDIADRYLIRERLEALAAELAARRIDEADNRARFLAALHTTEEAALGAAAAHRASNFRFHRAIAELSGNPQLASLIEQLWLPTSVSDQRDALGLSQRWGESLREHEAIAAAILAHDTAAAAEAMRHHLRQGGTRVLAATTGVFAEDRQEGRHGDLRGSS